MEVRRYQVMITGMGPLLMHRDNLSWAEVMKQWSIDPANKDVSVRGDDRSPAWRWIGNLYTNSGIVAMPADNLMTLLREGGAKCPTGGPNNLTFKRQTQSGIVVDQVAWPIVGARGEIPCDPIDALINNADFRVHERTASDLGFELFVKRAKVGPSKHVRVRPRFTVWSCEGTVTVFDEMITRDVLRKILTFGGTYCGLGDWRPSSPKSPGPFGKFTAVVKEV